MTKITIYIPKKLLTQATAAAAKADITLNDLIRERLQDMTEEELNQASHALDATIASKIEARIKSEPSGWVFSLADFIDIACRPEVTRALARMATAGVIRRIARGLYDAPRFNPILNKSSTSSNDQILKAISRRDGIRVVNDNVVHANGLGLTNAVPAKLIYLTDGPSRTINVGGWSLHMKHATPAFMSIATSKAGPAFQALMWLGEDVINASSDLPSRIRRNVPAEMLAELQRRSSEIPIWMNRVVEEAANHD